ncbi:MAG: PrsW family intramembrane metalloprotease [Saprospirales bacterium]|nr:PrsW family intramembrane metalloprotease [Saprospirales bacterium]MBK8921981.1 PrsW family intramembrane metalloprotease [Saprospirales bacterium]
MDILLTILAVLPGLLISYGIFRADKYEREPLTLLVFCFVIGGSITFPVVAIERWAFAWSGTPPFHLLQTALLSFGVLAFTEEAAKFFLLRALAFPQRFFNEPIDGIVYAVLIAMGFATVENIAYANRFGLHTLLVRSLTAVPAHLVFGIVQGYYAGLARFDPPSQSRLLTRGLVLAIALHGAYDLLILQNWSHWLVVLGTFGLYLSLLFCGRLIQHHQEHSPFRTTDRGDQHPTP